MRRRDQRLIVVIAACVMLAAAAGLTLVGLRNSVAYFVAPSEVAMKAKEGQRLRLGGLVAAGSVRHEANGDIRFIVADNAGEVSVLYNGALPDLFTEGQGVVAEGELVDGVFVADRLLAKHDETYMPREVEEALKERGEWKGEE